MIDELNQRLQILGYTNRQVLDIQGLAVIRIDNDGFIIYIHPYVGIVHVGLAVDMSRLDLERWLFKNEYFDYGVAVIDRRTVLMGFLDISADDIISSYILKKLVTEMKANLRGLVYQSSLQ